MRGLDGWDDDDDDDAEDHLQVDDDGYECSFSNRPEAKYQQKTLVDVSCDSFKAESSARRDLRGSARVADAPGISMLETLRLRVTDQHLASGDPEQKKQLNILLLGETGVGKSTMINAFANYITFESMEDAMSANRDLVALVYMCFTHTDMRDFTSHLIEHGEADPNEQHKGGQAVTQACRSYTFPLSEDFSVHIIDTPGIGDTRGVEQDQINFNGILAYLTNYDVIHGICVLLKPNTARLSITFSFCIKELLCHLHKSASDNIVFLFTCTRGSCYTPGDTVTPLKELLKQVKSSPPHVDIPFNGSTVYCVDNEAFRLVLTSKKGFPATERDKQAFSESWSRSAEQCRHMLEHFGSIEPHNVRETVCLNTASRMVKNLQEPMGTVGKWISQNMESLQKKQEELWKFKGTVKELEAKIEVQELELKAEGYAEGAATVCYGAKCCEDIESKETGEVERRPKICHQPCSSASNANFGDRASWFCSAIGFFGDCKRCGCSKSAHQRITYVPHVVAKKRALKAAVMEQVEAGDAMEACRLQIKEVRLLYEEYEQESAAIVRAAAGFAYFFKNNAIASYNDSMKAYVQHQIEAEKFKPGCSEELVKRLEKLLESYEKNREEVERLARDGKGDGSAEGVMKATRGLYNLKHTGPKLRHLVETVTKVEQSTAKRRDKYCPVPPTPHFSNLLKRVMYRGYS